MFCDSSPSQAGPHYDGPPLQFRHSSHHLNGKPADGISRVKWLRHAPQTNTQLFGEINDVQEVSQAPSKPVQFVEHDDVELAVTGILGHPAALWTLLQGNGARDTIVQVFVNELEA